LSFFTIPLFSLRTCTGLHLLYVLCRRLGVCGEQ
jgi:hypothetical protein